MTRRGQATATREALADAASSLINRRGYAGASISDVLAATGLEKGGLYNHFHSKEALALAGFDRSMERLDDFFRRELTGVPEGLPYLRAFITTFGKHARRPVVEGGCPIANTAVDADDGLPALRARVVTEVGRIRKLLTHHVGSAVASGELRATDPAQLADCVFATLEGAAVLGRAVRSNKLVDACVASLETYLDMLAGGRN